jgi:hypothetical protein
MMRDRAVLRERHGLAAGLRQTLSHGLITLLAVAMAFSLPTAARYILYEWWPLVEADGTLLLATEIAFGSLLVLGLNLVRISWEGRFSASSIKLAGLVFARDGERGWLSRWRERRLMRHVAVARDAFVLTLTGHETFVDERSLFRPALDNAYEIRVMLLDPGGAGIRRRIDHLPDHITLDSFREEIAATVRCLADLRKTGKNIELRFCDAEPDWKVVILGDHLWVQHCHAGHEVRSQPEYVFALQQERPREGFFVPFYTHFLDRWNDPSHARYDFDSAELEYRDANGDIMRRVALTNGADCGGDPETQHAEGAPPESALILID